MTWRVSDWLIDNGPPAVLQMIAVIIFVNVTDLELWATVLAWFGIVLALSGATRWSDAVERWNKDHPR